MKSKNRTIVVNDKMQKNYRYILSEPISRNFSPDFKPDLTPAEMLKLGIFGGKYMTDCQEEFPPSWFKGVKFNSKYHDPKLNFFKVLSGQPLSVWREKGWIYHEDPRGWFQWYCRYYFGRRIPKEDERQIKRWKAFNRHLVQVGRNCPKEDFSCRPRQRQALLQWAYDSRKL